MHNKPLITRNLTIIYSIYIYRGKNIEVVGHEAMDFKQISNKMLMGTPIAMSRMSRMGTPLCPGLIQRSAAMTGWRPTLMGR
jgi:hypothetical protein